MVLTLGPNKFDFNDDKLPIALEIVCCKEPKWGFDIGYW